MPKFWRPKLDESQRRDAGIIHWDLVTRFCDGTATADDLWDWIETSFTYSQMMRMLAEDGTDFTPEAMNAIAEQLDTYGAVIERFRHTGRVGFDAEQLRIARAAANVMDALLEADRHGIAVRAGQWAIEQTHRARNSARTLEASQ
ncbi:MAG: hypothetical protein EOO29_11465 [Comamonadaceae bacterium]|nr:MAG: hypothetical protein EOO29_11465 [Comamonadaceae bacterium]